MNIKDEIKVLLVRSHLSLSKLVEEMNKKYNRSDSIQNLSGKLNRDTLKVKELIEILDTLGYEIKFISKIIEE